ncbi:hypothetical protein Ciccas_007786 [Cichlidogyrus casuarinus]|uniref:Uncharacterized protein n=1 Tax=Cichlidogyrus casuarinus TaxID=1844966 RepID=A0ABD2Q1Y0_9PLAT
MAGAPNNNLALVKKQLEQLEKNKKILKDAQKSNLLDKVRAEHITTVKPEADIAQLAKIAATKRKLQNKVDTLSKIVNAMTPEEKAQNKDIVKELNNRRKIVEKLAKKESKLLENQVSKMSNKQLQKKLDKVKEELQIAKKKVDNERLQKLAGASHSLPLVKKQLEQLEKNKRILQDAINKNAPHEESSRSTTTVKPTADMAKLATIAANRNILQNKVEDLSKKVNKMTPFEKAENEDIVKKLEREKKIAEMLAKKEIEILEKQAPKMTEKQLEIKLNEVKKEIDNAKKKVEDERLNKLAGASNNLPIVKKELEQLEKIKKVLLDAQKKYVPHRVSTTTVEPTADMIKLRTIAANKNKLQNKVEDLSQKVNAMTPVEKAKNKDIVEELKKEKQIAKKLAEKETKILEKQAPRMTEKQLEKKLDEVKKELNTAKKKVEVERLNKLAGASHNLLLVKKQLEQLEKNQKILQDALKEKFPTKLIVPVKPKTFIESLDSIDSDKKDLQKKLDKLTKLVNAMSPDTRAKNKDIDKELEKTKKDLEDIFKKETEVLARNVDKMNDKQLKQMNARNAFDIIQANKYIVFENLMKLANVPHNYLALAEKNLKQLMDTRRILENVRKSKASITEMPKQDHTVSTKADLAKLATIAANKKKLQNTVDTLSRLVNAMTPGEKTKNKDIVEELKKEKQIAKKLAEKETKILEKQAPRMTEKQLEKKLNKVEKEIDDAKKKVEDERLNKLSGASNNNLALAKKQLEQLETNKKILQKAQEMKLPHKEISKLTTTIKPTANMAKLSTIVANKNILQNRVEDLSNKVNAMTPGDKAKNKDIVKQLEREKKMAERLAKIETEILEKQVPKMTEKQLEKKLNEVKKEIVNAKKKVEDERLNKLSGASNNNLALAKKQLEQLETNKNILQEAQKEKLTTTVKPVSVKNKLQDKFDQHPDKLAGASNNLPIVKERLEQLEQIKRILQETTVKPETAIGFLDTIAADKKKLQEKLDKLTKIVNAMSLDTRAKNKDIDKELEKTKKDMEHLFKKETELLPKLVDKISDKKLKQTHDKNALDLVKAKNYVEYENLMKLAKVPVNNLEIAKMQLLHLEKNQKILDDIQKRNALNSPKSHEFPSLQQLQKPQLSIVATTTVLPLEKKTMVESLHDMLKNALEKAEIANKLLTTASPNTVGSKLQPKIENIQHPVKLTTAQAPETTTPPVEVLSEIPVGLLEKKSEPHSNIPMIKGQKKPKNAPLGFNRMYKILKKIKRLGRSGDANIKVKLGDKVINLQIPASKKTENIQHAVTVIPVKLTTAQAAETTTPVQVLSEIPVDILEKKSEPHSNIPMIKGQKKPENAPLGFNRMYKILKKIKRLGRSGDANIKVKLGDKLVNLQIPASKNDISIEDELKKHAKHAQETMIELEKQLESCKKKLERMTLNIKKNFLHPEQLQMTGRQCYILQLQIEIMNKKNELSDLKNRIKKCEGPAGKLDKLKQELRMVESAIRKASLRAMKNNNSHQLKMTELDKALETLRKQLLEKQKTGTFDKSYLNILKRLVATEEQKNILLKEIAKTDEDAVNLNKQITELKSKETYLMNKIKEGERKADKKELEHLKKHCASISQSLNLLEKQMREIEIRKHVRNAVHNWISVKDQEAKTPADHLHELMANILGDNGNLKVKEIIKSDWYKELAMHHPDIQTLLLCLIEHGYKLNLRAILQNQWYKALVEKSKEKDIFHLTAEQDIKIPGKKPPVTRVHFDYIKHANGASQEKGKNPRIIQQIVQRSLVTANKIVKTSPMATLFLNGQESQVAVANKDGVDCEKCKNKAHTSGVRGSGDDFALIFNLMD